MRSLIFSLSVSLSFCTSACWRFCCCCFSAGCVSFSFLVQKRTRTWVGRRSRRSQRLRFRSLCAFCDCKKQQQQEARKLNKNKFSSRVCGFLLSSAFKTVLLSKSCCHFHFIFWSSIYFVDIDGIHIHIHILFLIAHSCWQYICEFSKYASVVCFLFCFSCDVCYYCKMVAIKLTKYAKQWG